MDDNEIPRDVILNFGPDSQFGGFWRHFASGSIFLDNGNKVFRLECSRVDETAHYLAVEISGQSSLAGTPLRIPHHMVLAIVDIPLSEKDFQFGFVPSQKSS